MLTPRVQKPEIAGQQYAVVLVNEDQLNQLMRRPAMRQVNSRFTLNDALARIEKLKRRTTAAAIVLLVLVAGALAWVFVPQPAMASMFDWSKPSASDALHRRQLQRHHRVARQRRSRQRCGGARA